MIAAGSRDSKKIFFIKKSKERGFNVVGFSVLPSKVAALHWNTSSKQQISSANRMLFVLVNFLLIGIVPPDANLEQNDLKL